MVESRDMEIEPKVSIAGVKVLGRNVEGKKVLGMNVLGKKVVGKKVKIKNMTDAIRASMARVTPPAANAKRARAASTTPAATTVASVDAAVEAMATIARIDVDNAGSVVDRKDDMIDIVRRKVVEKEVISMEKNGMLKVKKVNPIKVDVGINV